MSEIEIGDVVLSRAGGKIWHEAEVVEIDRSNRPYVCKVNIPSIGSSPSWRELDEVVLLRKAPKLVCDAHGVEIRVGDWIMTNRGMFRVDSFEVNYRNEECVVFEAEGDIKMSSRGKDVIVYRPVGSQS